MSVTEWANDDRLHHDIGGGLSSRMAKRWMDDLGFGWEQMPNFKVHSQADEEHSDMFLEDLERFAVGEKETHFRLPRSRWSFTKYSAAASPKRWRSSRERRGQIRGVLARSPLKGMEDFCFGQNPPFQILFKGGFCKELMRK